MARTIRSSRMPHQTPDLRDRIVAVCLCTTRVAVTHSPLDRTKTSRLKSECAKIFFAKFSTRQKYFVLVCRLFYFLKFSCCPGKSAPTIREAFCSNNEISSTVIINSRALPSRRPRDERLCLFQAQLFPRTHGFASSTRSRKRSTAIPTTPG